MLILTLRTDKPEAEIGLYEDGNQLSYVVWQAHRQLAEKLHMKLDDLIKGHDKKLSDIKGIVVFQGPGSFTGLRIGLSVANALAYGLKAPIVGELGPAWIESGIERITHGETDGQVLPFYGSDVHITPQKK